MKLRLERNVASEKATLGTLFVDGEQYCYTLEDAMRDEKVKHETAIPYGTYKVVLSYSPRFKQEMPLLLDVPEYEGIRIHPGNVPAHTSGCILVGFKKHPDERISESARAYAALFKLLSAAKDPITIEIVPGESLLNG